MKERNGGNETKVKKKTIDKT